MYNSEVESELALPLEVLRQRESPAPARVLTEGSCAVRSPHQITGSGSFWEHEAAGILLRRSLQLSRLRVRLIVLALRPGFA